MAEKIPQLGISEVSLESMYAQLVSFAYVRDHGFKVGTADATEDIHRSKTVSEVGSLGEDEEDDALDGYDDLYAEPLYDMRTLSFDAMRDSTQPKSPPSRIKIGLELQNQLIALPNVLMSQLSDEVKDDYGDSHVLPGDLQELQAVEYIVTNSEGEIEVVRNLSYTLLGRAASVLYMKTELDRDTYEHVVVASEQATLHIAQTIGHEAMPDTIQDATGATVLCADRLLMREQYSDLTDGSNMDLYNSLLEMRDREAALCIVALLTSMRTGSAIPDVIHEPLEPILAERGLLG